MSASHKSRSVFLLAALAACLPIAASSARGQTVVTGGRLVVNSTQDVIATYLGNSATHTDDLFLDSPANVLGRIFRNQTDIVGKQVDLGSFPVGTELVFRMFDNNTGYNYFTGPASRNPDGHFHAKVTYDYTPTATLVQFEDLYNGPFNYNDLSFSFTNVAIPEPSGPAMSLLAGGLLGLRRRR